MLLHPAKTLQPHGIHGCLYGGKDCWRRGDQPADNDVFHLSESASLPGVEGGPKGSVAKVFHVGQAGNEYILNIDGFGQQFRSVHVVPPQALAEGKSTHARLLHSNAIDTASTTRRRYGFQTVKGREAA